MPTSSSSGTSWPGSRRTPGSSTRGAAPASPCCDSSNATRRAIGLDFSARQLTLARAAVPRADLIHADLGALPFRDEHFDAVVSFYAVIHVPRRDHLAILRECRRVLRPGGFALLCLGAQDVPDDRDPTSWLGTPMYWSHYDAATNLELLRDAGLDVITPHHVEDPMGHGWHLFALAARRDPHPIGRRR